ncbi:MAG: ribulose-phosphate 3-epimerase [Lentisphaerae bacterium]|nr:ribulose-phosphate 3-epimerase [Lentisphaerota bacterium]
MKGQGSLLDELRATVPTLSIGVLTADLMNLDAELTRIRDAGARILHFDIMDGRFCPMLTMGAPVVKAIQTPLWKDVHLMVEDPLGQVESVVTAGADMVTFNVESCRHPHRVLQVLGQMENVNDPSRGIVRGVALNPGTPLQVLEPLLDNLEMVVLLAVDPGWGGQQFTRATTRRMAVLLEMLRQAEHDTLVSVDGGVTRDNIDEVASTAADIIVTGSAVFDGRDPESNARGMLETVARVHRTR